MIPLPNAGHSTLPTYIRVTIETATQGKELWFQLSGHPINTSGPSSFEKKHGVHTPPRNINMDIWKMMGIGKCISSFKYDVILGFYVKFRRCKSCDSQARFLFTAEAFKDASKNLPWCAGFYFGRCSVPNMYIQNKASSNQNRSDICDHVPKGTPRHIHNLPLLPVAYSRTRSVKPQLRPRLSSTKRHHHGPWRSSAPPQ